MAKKRTLQINLDAKKLKEKMGLKDGAPGPKGDPGDDGAPGLPGPQGNPGVPGKIEDLSAIEMAEKLNPEKEIVEQSVIIGLLDTFEKIWSELKRIGALPRGGGGGAKNATKFVDLSSQTNGTKKVFSVPKSVAAIVLCSDFPSVLMENNGFTLNSSRTQLTLTVTNAPSTGSQLLFQYTSVFNT